MAAAADRGRDDDVSLVVIYHIVRRGHSEMTIGAILGPQRTEPTVAAALDQLGVQGRVAMITAGWQEREDEDEALREALDRPAVNLQLHARLERVFAADPELFSAHRAKQDQLKRLQRAYRLRLTHASRAVRALQALVAEEPDIDPEITDAIEVIRALDAHHIGRLEQVEERFEAELAPLERTAIARQRQPIQEALAESNAVAVAGGHVAALLTRLRLFRLAPLMRPLPIVAWSAGAMALSHRVVLFHDRPPQGPSNAEVLGLGLGLFGGLLPLPHAKARLRLGDKGRVSRFARRFAPDVGVALDSGDMLLYDGNKWQFGAGTRRLLESGKLAKAMT